MSGEGFILFPTAIGACALVWGEHGLRAVYLPDTGEPALRQRLGRRFPAARELAPPPPVQRAVDGITALLAGAHDDLRDIALDLREIPAFHRRAYEVARAIPPGRTMSYGEIAERLGEGPAAARAVGQAMARNRFPIVVPCHRVLAAHGKAGGFTAPGGLVTKLQLLQIEGAPLNGDAPGLFD